MDVLFAGALDPGRLVLLVLLCVATAFGALSTGMALARGWKPIWQVWIYCILLGLVFRFLLWGLFYTQSEFIWPLLDDTSAFAGSDSAVWGFWADTVLLLLIGTLGFLVTRARRMVEQYPWLHERSGLTGWREKPGSSEQP